MVNAAICAAACQGAHVMKPVSPVKPQQCKVSISYNEKTGRLRVSPKTIILNGRKRQEILWRCRNATMEIAFEPDCTPFRAFRWRCPNGGGCLSGVPRRQSKKEQLFKYTIKVLDTLNGATSEATVKASRTTKSGGTKKASPPKAERPVLLKEAFLVVE